MDKITKALTKLSAKEREVVKSILLRLREEQLAGLGIQKLKGRKDIFRVRKGRIRIVYRRTGAGTAILAIERRSETTYKKF